MSNPPHHLLLNQILQWRETLVGSSERGLSLGPSTVIAGVLCLVSSSISSAGGVGGGALFLPILNLVAGLDLKKASTFSAFMVTGGAVSNVLYNMCFRNNININGGKSLIDYDIALLSEPCMLLGVSLGVISNVVFPEWLITLLFVILLACSTFKTCRSGLVCWKAESDEVRRRDEYCNLESEVREEKGLEEPLLGGGEEGILGIPWKRMGVLVLVWVSFFLVDTLKGDEDGKSIVQIRPCSTAYWLIMSSQIPLAIIFTAYILYEKQSKQNQAFQQQADVKDFEAGIEIGKFFPKVTFPAAALMAGVLGGLFGIGGGLLMNPVLLQIGIHPQVAAATSSFMVLFSSSMSSVQYLMLGMKNIDQALVMATGCFVASLVGLVIVQRAVRKYGRASLIIFSVSTVMALSTISMSCFGTMDVWREYTTGQYMGFRLPC